MNTSNLLTKAMFTRASTVGVLSLCLFGASHESDARGAAESRPEVAHSLYQPSLATVKHCGPHRSVCEHVARAARQASMFEAKEDFLLGIAKCISRGESFMDCLPDAWQEFREARDLAHEQYEARLEVCELIGCGAYNPNLNPNLFDSTVDNDFFPLIPNRTLVYEKTTDEGVETIRVTTLVETVEIAGIECSVVQDIVDLDGEVIEDTSDWYAQHENGDVWYIGEIAKNFEDGLLSDLDGSWRTGEEGALAGIIMRADPSPGDAYRQEFLLDDAEDVGLVISLGETVTVPYGTFTGCLQTEDFTPLEPGVVERKFYAPGIGVILEVDLESGERTELIDIIEG